MTGAEVSVTKELPSRSRSRPAWPWITTLDSPCSGTSMIMQPCLLGPAVQTIPSYPGGPELLPMFTLPVIFA